MLFKSVAAILVVVFLYYGMDVRRKAGTRYFVTPVWQSLMKICSFALITAFMWVALSIRQLGMIRLAEPGSACSGDRLCRRSETRPGCGAYLCRSIS